MRIEKKTIVIKDSKEQSRLKEAETMQSNFEGNKKCSGNGWRIKKESLKEKMQSKIKRMFERNSVICWFREAYSKMNRCGDFIGVPFEKAKSLAGRRC